MINGVFHLKITRQALKHILKLFLGIAIIAAIFIYTGLDKSVAILLKTDLTLLSSAFIIFSASWIFRAARLRSLFHEYRIRDIKNEDVYKTNFAANALNIVLPLKLGDISQMYIFHTKFKIPLKESVISVIYTRIFDILALSIIGFTTLMLVMSERSIQNFSTYIAIFLLMISATAFVTSSTVQAQLVQYIGKNRPTLSKIILSFRLSRKCRAISMIYSLLAWIMEGLTTYVVFRSLGQDIPLSIAFLGLAVANMVKIIPATPGGIGLFEGTMAILYVSFGVNPNTAIVAATLDHLVKNINVLIFGIPSLISYKYDTTLLNRWKEKVKRTIFNT